MAASLPVPHFSMSRAAGFGLEQQKKSLTAWGVSSEMRR
jgi:hypothetical protein